MDTNQVLNTMVNDYKNAIKTIWIKEDLKETLNIQDSTFEDFLKYR